MSKLVELMEDFCNVDKDIRFMKDYSGRCMFGRKCVGIVCHDYLNTLLKLCEYLAIFDVIDFEDELGKVCLDNMGLDYIMYFPSVESD